MIYRGQQKKDKDSFPISHLSASSMCAFTANPILWKIKYINGDYIDTTTGIPAILGQSVHYGLDIYYGGGDVPMLKTDDPFVEALKAAADHIAQVPDGFVKYSKTIPDKEKASASVAFCMNEYMKAYPVEKINVYASEQKIERQIDVEYAGQRLHLPIKLKGYVDLIERDKEGRLCIIDHKTCYSFSDPEKIDASKIIQAVVYYLLVLAETGETPYAMKYREVKYTKNKDGSPQCREYEVVYADNPLYFDLFFRLYEDITRALMGEMVWVPNFNALYDNEVAIVSYINRLDVEEDRARLMKKHKVENITDVLKKELHKTANMDKLRKIVEKQLSEIKSINYSKMTIPEKIQTKFAEFGIALRFDSKVEGATVTRYRFNPSTGIRMKTLRSHDADIEQAVGVTDIRVLAPEPGTTFVSFEIPNAKRTFYKSAPKAKGLLVPIGIDVGGNQVEIDITDAPHILIAGSTGSGKSVLLNSMLNSIRGNADLWLADPKQVELLDHKATKYADEPETIRAMLEDLVGVMDARYAEMKAKGKKFVGRPIVCVIDEFGDLMLENPEGSRQNNYNSWSIARLVREIENRHLGYEGSNYSSKQVYVDALNKEDEQNRGKYAHMSAEDLIVKLAQKARAASIHLIIATQRPSADVITGRIKTNLPTRIALRTGGEVDSRIILDQPGAEKLLGKGDALLLRSDSADFIRFQAFSV